MNLLFDTNILIFLIKDASHQLLANIVNPDDKKIMVSVASIGELKAMALQNNWGPKKLLALDNLLSRVSVVEVNESLTDTYAKIDAYSQRRSPWLVDYPFSTPRNMGKNDLWIAATAALLGLKLVTTDADFNHLHDVFIEVECLKPEQLKA
jgi:tRNA(fMet)-specific endonuclease VapC